LLKERLEKRTYQLQPYHAFKVYEPKERDVLAIDFEGKILQHSLCDNVLYPCLVRSFINDNYASQVGKGTHYGIQRLTKHLRHYFFSRKAGEENRCRLAGLPMPEKEHWNYSDGWVLKGDFKKYFYTIDHDILFEKVMKKIKNTNDREFIDFCGWLIRMIIDSTPDPGIPIGNQSSQLFALVNLDGFDHLIKDTWGIQYYGRYMDDFYIIHEDKEELKKILTKIEGYIYELKLNLNNKTQIFPLRHGINFLGFRTYLTKSGKVIKKLRNGSKNKMRRKIKKFRNLLDKNKITIEKILQSYRSWRGHASHGNTFNLIRRMDDYFFNTFPELRGKIKGVHYVEAIK
jgi:retron-type reverse transcriptase